MADFPRYITREQRAFPDANLLLLDGQRPTLVDSGFVGHAEQTLAWVKQHVDGLHLVINTHWHSDHVGANNLLQRNGVAVAASAPDESAVNNRDPGCCVAEYLDQPVAPYSVDEILRDGDRLVLGDAEWQVVATPGHTVGHLAFWQPDVQALVVGDALSSYDVGWVNLALDGPEATQEAVNSLNRLADLSRRTLLTAHGPLPTDVDAALMKALSRAQRLVDDPDGAVWYGARRVFAYALMIRGGVPVDEVERYLLDRAWLQDSARLLRMTPDAFVQELLTSMRTGGATTVRDGRLYASAEHSSVDRSTGQIPFPKDWPPR